MGGLDTTSTCVAAKGILSTAGYHAFANTNTSAGAMMGPSFAQSDAVWMINGHANFWTITTYGSGVETYLYPDLATIPAGHQVGTCAAPNACLSNYTKTQLRRIKLMLFAGCLSAGNLQNYASARGVDLAVGFTAELNNSRSGRWILLLFDWMATYGADYQNASYLATEQVIAQMGGAGGSDHRYEVGNRHITLKPPTYGSY
jgi:hypothetical protein